MAARARKTAEDMLLDHVRQQIPGVFIGRASEFAKLQRRLSQGLMSMDVGCGGGLVGGHVHQYSGRKSSGKTSAAMHVCATTQGNLKSPRILWAPFEPFERQWARSNGISIPYTDEELKVVEASIDRKLKPAEKKALRASKGEFHLVEGDNHDDVLEAFCVSVEGGNYDLAVIDSIGAIMPEAWEGVHFKDHPARGRHAALMQRFAKRIRKALRGKFTVVLLINHLKGGKDTGLYYPGGTDYEHLLDLDIRFKHNGWIVPKKGDVGDIKVLPAEKEAVGQLIHWKVEKTKIGGARTRHGSFIFFTQHYEGWKPGDIDVLKDAIDTGIALDVIEMRGGGHYYVEDKRVARGMDELRTWFSKDRKRLDILYLEILDQLERASITLPEL